MSSAAAWPKIHHARPQTDGRAVGGNGVLTMGIGFSSWAQDFHHVSGSLKTDAVWFECIRPVRRGSPRSLVRGFVSNRVMGCVPAGRLDMQSHGRCIVFADDVAINFY